MAKRDKDEVVTEISRTHRQKLKVLASLEAMTMSEWLGWVIDRAYESKVAGNKKRYISK